MRRMVEGPAPVQPAPVAPALPPRRLARRGPLSVAGAGFHAAPHKKHLELARTRNYMLQRSIQEHELNG